MTQPPEPPFTLEGFGDGRNVKIDTYEPHESVSSFGAMKVSVPICGSKVGWESLAISHRQLASMLSLEDLAVIRHEKERIERFSTPDSLEEI